MEKVDRSKSDQPKNQHTRSDATDCAGARCDCVAADAGGGRGGAGDESTKKGPH
jgi:hypothetical protein